MQSAGWAERSMHKFGDELLSRVRGILVGLPRPLKRLLMVLVDVALILAAAIAAILITSPALAAVERFPAEILLVIGGITVPVFWSLGLYRAVVRFLRSRVIIAVVIAVSVVAAGMAAYALAFPASGVSPGAALAFWAFAVVHTAGSRFTVRDFLHGQRKSAERAIIYGAGTSGARLANLLASGGECQPVAFIDDNKALHGSVVAGLFVYPPDALMKLVEMYHASRLLLAMPSASRQRRATIIQKHVTSPLHIQTVPDMNDLVSGKASFDDLREVGVDDLLGRDPVPPRAEFISACVAGRNVMVTGAGGSIGSELCRQIVRLGAARLVMVDHSEPALYAIEQELQALAGAKGLPIELVAVLGSVTEANFLRQILRSFDVRTLYHAAAYKHVPLVEYNMGIGIRNNVLGTYRTAMAAERAGVDTFVLVSTDKAVNPTNVMGATKRFAEVILQGMVERGTRMRICMVRFGNVLASSGSVVPRFREQIRAGGPVTVTHPEIERYFMTIPEAAQLVIEASGMGDAGDVFLLDMGRPVKIVELAERMIRLSGLYLRDAKNPEGDIEIVFTGLRPGEKLYEELLINGTAVATEHPRIWRASDGGATWGQVRAAVEAITKAVVNNDCDAMRRILLEVVPEYRPPSTFVDHVHQAARNGDAADLPEPLKLSISA
jgi:FlaA1/EpsC-like NDP-sugar epimerase